ncbi:hypothetical protein PENARI_c002G03733 [Penicillium arizonense]|uniref:Uncharacterized protein n=1 Tax=Penicillium arizonense TaxID=1835702 RepID=A0A1F5LVB6_PENAI|nr:hypothetical protein PENARI_c002G03733 [Penicillium arizonense]OGE57090.1 hypothetical protein PENARI_c002G03733 [Penicillium arizonense]
MAQTAVGRLFRQSTTSSVCQSMLRPSQVRSFGNKAAIPTFTSTPSAELNDALDRFRQELFIPLGLPKRQRKSMFKAKYAQTLEHDPITVKISENEEFTLTPKNKHELPSKKDAMEVLHMMVATKNFSNLFPFLSGLRMSNYILNNDRWEYIIRKAGQADKLGAVIECARQCSRTGLSLSNMNVARRLFFELHQMAQRADYQGIEVVKALDLAEKAASLMDSPEHSVRDDSASDPKQQPFVIGTLLELSAACALENEAAKTKVSDYARKLEAAWDLGKFTDDYPSPSEKQARVEENLAVIHGIELAHKLEKPSQSVLTLKSRMKPIRANLAEQLKSVKNKQVLNDKVAQRFIYW